MDESIEKRCGTCANWLLGNKFYPPECMWTKRGAPFWVDNERHTVDADSGENCDAWEKLE